MDYSLPPEVLEMILGFCLQSARRSPISPLLTSTFHSITSRLLYTHLHFRTILQLHTFLATFDPASPDTSTPIRYPPRTIELDLDADVSTRAFWHIFRLFTTYRDLQKAGFDKEGRIMLDLLRFGFDTHVRDEGLGMIEEALRLVNPHKFVWTGPTDIPHHFSIAIVPPAVPHLLCALARFTQLRELVLTHIALVNMPSLTVPFPCMPSLEKVYIGQATFVDPGRMGDVLVLNACDLPSSKLREVKFVDVYKESIWGPRLRRSDLEAAAAASVRSMALPSASPDHGQQVDTQEMEGRIEATRVMIRNIFVCQAKAERKYGGDRALESTSELL